ncbi:MAG: alpha/beta fold hydrolase [Solirubrobacterales bacterium]|nr:alpha/beta fold hydrolase [Solirubrobacterales bacterium]
MAGRETIEIHGHPVTFHRFGQGPAVLLLHGITSSSRTWKTVTTRLARDYTVIAPDLLGHGRSAKPEGDYTLGGYASGVRDLMIALGIPKATVVGHSLGGGIAMQFAYQFPQRVSRLALVSSGGLGREVNPILRAATLPGSELVLPFLFTPKFRDAMLGLRRVLGKGGLKPSADLEGVADGFASLTEADARKAFLDTVRSVIGPAGQRVSADDRLYLTTEIPSLILWGENDRIIPVAHANAAHELMPGSRLEIFEGAGHFPFNDDPERFATVLREFIEETEPADLDDDHFRWLLEEHGTVSPG